jgi:hypothetical protein
MTLIPWDTSWNILNYRWGLFQTNLNFWYLCIILNNISDKKKTLVGFLSLYQKWLSHIIPNNMLYINIIHVLIFILKVSNRFYQKMNSLYFLKYRPKSQKYFLRFFLNFKTCSNMFVQFMAIHKEKFYLFILNKTFYIFYYWYF